MKSTKQTALSQWRKMPRGMRNNNPLNIRRAKTKWVGETDCISITEIGSGQVTQVKDTTFCQFFKLEQGWRAAFILLKKYIIVHKLTTIRKIINRWAPSNENNTNQYIMDVSFQACVQPDDEISFSNEDVMLRIGAAMCVVENGSAYCPLFNENWKVAMVGGYMLAASYKV